MANGKYQRWLQPEGLVLLEGWARDGLTDEQIARKIGIGVSTLYEWKKRYTEIAAALEKGKEVADFQVENALLKSALGYRYTEAIEVGTSKGVMQCEITKEVAPNVTAQIFWLKNRRPDKWRSTSTVVAEPIGGSGVVMLPEVESSD